MYKLVLSTAWFTNPLVSSFGV